MTAKMTQFATKIEVRTKQKLDRVARERGMTSMAITQRALDAYLHALDEVPDEYIVPRHVVIAASDLERLVDRAESDEVVPTIRDLMASAGDDDEI